MPSSAPLDERRSCASTEAGHCARRRQAGDRQPARSVAGRRAEAAAGHQAIAAARHGGADRPRPIGLHRRVDQERLRTIGEAILLVVLIIFLFLHSVRATLIPLVTIPVSLIGAFALMYAFDFSINTLTLLALVLAIGLVVDDAIVMLENIYRHVEEGMPPVKAALLGSREISFAVIAMTITLAAVYTPIGFMTGVTGRLFTEFAWTLAGAVIVSGFVALTLSPMMCSKLLRARRRAQCLQPVDRASPAGRDAALSRAAQARARRPPARSACGPRGCGIELFPVFGAQGRACPGRGSGEHHCRFPRPRGRHDRIHRRQRQEARSDCPRRAGSRPRIRRRRQSDRVARPRYSALEALGGAQPHPAGDRAGDCAGHCRGARRRGLPQQSAAPRSRARGRSRSPSSSKPRAPTPSSSKWSRPF